jgi:hypothetical protein
VNARVAALLAWPVLYVGLLLRLQPLAPFGKWFDLSTVTATPARALLALVMTAGYLAYTATQWTPARTPGRTPAWTRKEKS